MGAQVTLLGTDDAIGRAVDAIPPAVDVTLDRTGPYTGTFAASEPVLAERQRQVLDIALDVGYYEVPREATHRDIAACLGLAPGTVSEHLQQTEHQLVAAQF